MYSILELKSSVRVSPILLEEELKESIKKSLYEEYVGKLGKDGIFLAVLDVKEIGEGTIIPGDGAIYYEVNFEAVVYKPMMHEVVDGFVTEIAGFGAFVRVGPIEGLVHISQVMDDYVSYSESGSLQGKESNRSLKVGDNVRARIVAVSLKSIEGAKLGLTMRQPGLGKIKWIESDTAGGDDKDEKIKKNEKIKKKGVKKDG